MTATPSAAVVRQRSWQISLAVVAVALLFAYSGVLRELVELLTTKAGHSHSLLIVPFIVLQHADGDTRLGVAQACSGLSMILAFVALSAAIAFLYKSRPKVDRAILFARALPISLVCDMLRIVVAGLVYYAGWTKLGDPIVHDLAGWLMMPLALLILWLELRVMDRVTAPVETVSTNELLGLNGREPWMVTRGSSNRGGPFNPLEPLTAGGPWAGPNPMRPEPRANAGTHS